MKHRLTRKAQEQAQGLKLEESEVIRMARQSAPYTDEAQGYLNRRFDEYLLRVGDNNIHAVVKIQSHPADKVMELMIMARDALRDTITPDLDDAIKENADWVLEQLEKATPQ